jgi:hypothetical protein
MTPLTHRDDELAAPVRTGQIRPGFMTVIGPSALASCRTSIIDLLRGAAPVEFVRVRLSKPDGIVVDSEQWQVSSRDPADIAAEIARYITGYGPRVEATIIGWSDH